MKNADSPAAPVENEILNQLTHICVTESLGLTKREHFAGLAMQGLLSCNATYGGRENKEMLVADAVQTADALLAELDKS